MTELEKQWEPLPKEELLPEFPVWRLPRAIREYVMAVAFSVQVPIGMPGVFALGAAATALLGKASLRVKGDYEEPLNLYLVVAANPSERKSAALAAMFKPLWDFIGEENKRREPLVTKGQYQKRVLDAQIQRAEKKGDMLGIEALLQKQQKPTTYLELMATDVTPEALVRAMARNEGRMAVVSGEGALFNVLAGAYSEEVNLDVLLNGYSGEPIRVERIGRETEAIEKSAVAITLAVQPVMLDRLLANETLLGRGLTARFLYTKPQSWVGSRSFRETAPVGEAVREDYVNHIKALAAYQNGSQGFELFLCEEAYDLFCDWFDKVEKRIADEWQGIAGGWEGKLCGNTLRLAGLLRMLEDSDTLGPVTGEHMAGAIEIADYFVAHIRSLTGSDGGLSVLAKEVLKEIVKGGEATVGAYDLKQKLRFRKQFKNAAKVDEGIRELQAAGYLRYIIPKEGERSTKYAVHPELLVQQNRAI